MNTITISSSAFRNHLLTKWSTYFSMWLTFSVRFSGFQCTHPIEKVQHIRASVQINLHTDTCAFLKGKVHANTLKRWREN